MKLVTVQTFDNYFAANLLLTRLQSEGVECYLQDENTVTIDPILCNAIGGIKLVVTEADVAAVTKRIRQYHIDYMLSATCPECGSNSFSHVAKPAVGNYLTAIFTWLLGSYALAPDYVYECGNCGYTCETLPDKDPSHEMAPE